MRSLRGRLALGVLVVLAAVLAVAGVLASRSAQRSAEEAFDDRLVRTAELSRATARSVLQEEIPDDDRRLDAVLRASGTSLRLVLGETELLRAGSPLPHPAALRTGLRTYTFGGRPYRAYVTTIRDQELGGLARLEVVGSLGGLERRQDELDHRLLALGALALVAAGIGAWIAAELILRPLRRLRAVAASIAEHEDLDRRVPTDDGPAELRSLASSFNAMLARLGRSAADRERALDATRRFAADVGHELRTPLTSVQATLSTLGRHPDLPAERRGELVADAVAEQRRLVDLLDGLQALVRGDATPVEHAEVDLAEVADGVVTGVAAGHPEVRLTADLPDDPVLVSGWEPGLRLLVENLVVNAARHGRPGGRVHVVVQGGDVPALVVEDDGPGIPPEERERVFEAFARLDGGERPGSGLGLALVAQQARHHGATVAIDDAALGGARFTVRFCAGGTAVA
ncbi:MAG: HAMP domain-containing histidine kinase [Solirubrobacterales bacterium]|nr:HAMP domain-containing histidine kinase [Solirubrobacterales bacterium]